MKSLGKTNVYFTSLGVFAVSFATTLLVSSSLAPASDSNADILRVEQTSSGYTVSITSADNVNIDLNSTPTGVTAVAKDTIKTITNSPNGYKLYVSSLGATSNLYKDGNSTSSYFISPTTGTITAPSSLADNSWGYALGNAEPATFAAMPTSSSPQIVQTATEATPAAGNTLDVWYGVRTTSALPSGTYTGRINYTITTDASVSNIDVAAIYPTLIDADSNSELTITTSLFTNYDFAASDLSVKISGTSTNGTTVNSLCGVQNIDTETGALSFTCIAPKLSAGTYDVTVSIPKFSKTYTLGQTLTYYTVPEFFKISNMQEMTTDICNSATTPAVDAAYADTTGTHTGDTSYVPQRVLYDIRDGNSYRVRKLADGNCWMTENLRLIFNEDTVLTPDDTDVTETILAGTITTTETEETRTVWDPENLNDESIVNAWHSYSATNDTASTLDSDVQKIGVHYNWYTSTAGSGTWAMTSLSSNASNSICPKGWVLPNGGDKDTSKSFANLISKYLSFFGASSVSSVETSVGMRKFPLSFIFHGYYDPTEGKVIWIGTYGAFTNSTPYNNIQTVSSIFDRTSVLLQHPNQKRSGRPVRCVSR